VAWTNSKVFQEWVLGPMFQSSGTGYTGIDSDTMNIAMYNNSITPDNTAVVGSTGYNTGVWVAGANEQTDATNWVAGGRPLASKTFTTPVAGTLMFDAADLSGGGNVTIGAAWGCLDYDNTITAGTVAKQGASYHYFGGQQQVTAGTFTIVWHANGLIRVTV
jgi:hypothetical protein